MNDRANRHRSLRDIVTERVDVKWAEFEAEHPHLAAAVTRTVIIDTAVERVADDPAVRDALDQAARDKASLAVTEHVVGVIDRWVRRVLAL